MRVLYLPINYMGIPQVSMYDAWESNGVEFKVFDWIKEFDQVRNYDLFNQNFVQQAIEYQPDFIFMQLNYINIPITVESLQEVKLALPNVKIANWTGDVRYESDDLTEYSKVIDLPLISSTGQLDFYRSRGCSNVKYWQVGFDPKFNYPMWKTDFIHDVCFTGNNYRNSIYSEASLRVDTVNRLHQEFRNKFCLYGGGWIHINDGMMCNDRQANQHYNDSLCVVSISNDNSLADYFSNRLLICVASGRPTISWHFPNIENHFIPDQEILVAHSAEEVVEKVRWCKEHPEEANEIGRNGCKRAFDNYTYTHRIKQLLEMVNET